VGVELSENASSAPIYRVSPFGSLALNIVRANNIRLSIDRIDEDSEEFSSELKSSQKLEEGGLDNPYYNPRLLKYFVVDVRIKMI